MLKGDEGINNSTKTSLFNERIFLYWIDEMIRNNEQQIATYGSCMLSKHDGQTMGFVSIVLAEFSGGTT